MQWKMHENSLFAVLLRSPWWVSVLIAAGIGGVSRLLLPDAYWLYGASGTLPFVGIAVLAARRQWSVPGTARVEAVQAALKAMSWREFSDLLEAAFVRDGYRVARVDMGAADFELSRNGYTTLVSAKRWKAASQGLGPLEELAASCRKRDAREGMMVSLADPTENARRFALQNGMQLVHGTALAQLLRDFRPA